MGYWMYQQWGSNVIKKCLHRMAQDPVTPPHTHWYGELEYAAPQNTVDRSESVWYRLHPVDSLAIGKWGQDVLQGDFECCDSVSLS